jgi:hypothetical protein
MRSPAAHSSVRGGEMVSLSEFSDLVSKIYEAAFDFERWPLVLETVSHALGGSTHSTLTLHALAEGRLGATALGRDASR